MASNLKEKYCILWDLNTCKSKSITSIVHYIRQVYVRNNSESGFWCFTIKDINKQKELEFKNDIKIIQKKKLIDLYDILTKKITSFVEKSAFEKFKPNVILITGGLSFQRIIEPISGCGAFMLIYGESASKDIIRLAQNKIPFEKLKISAQNNNDSNNSLSSIISIDVENYTSNDIKVKSKSKSTLKIYILGLYKSARNF
jgi:hypothetical protein